MAKISRVKQVLFGSTGNASDFGQPGSINTTKTNTKDPSTIQALSAFLAGLASIVKSGTYKVALEDLNSLFLLAFYQISYLMQSGIAEWDSETEYYTGSLVNVGGSIYKSLSDANVGNNPASDAVNWVLVSGVSVGTIHDFAGPAANIPAGFLVCDGSAVNRTTYANLFAAIGTAWGSGNGSTTFNIPNLKGLVTAGYDSTQTEFNAVGKTGGEKTHTLTVDEMPSHSHEVPRGVLLDGTRLQRALASTDENANIPSASTGGGQPHNNIQPYGTVLKIIKY